MAYRNVLTPIRFLERASTVFGDRIAVVDGSVRLTYAELWKRCTKIAGALREAGVHDGDRVVLLAPNSLPLLEAHYAVPLAGATLVAINTRLSAVEVSTIVDHCEPRAIIYDSRLNDTALMAVDRSSHKADVSLRIGGSNDAYEQLVASGGERVMWPQSEFAMIAINYTSGTTGHPKGVVYSHRGAYLQTLAMAFHMALSPDCNFLWTLPMFHCNGWCFTWAVTAAGGRHICVERPVPDQVWALIEKERVTHFNCAPTVLSDLLESPHARRRRGGRIIVAVGGAPPSPTLLTRARDSQLEVTHLYGLTETYGPAVICEWRPEWRELPAQDQARLKARQGVGNVVTNTVRVLTASGAEMPADGISVGEIAISGDNVMLGYYRDAAGTEAVLRDGLLRTGDLGVQYPDGYVEITDRAKDIIVSGGENVASVEVERAILSYPGVVEAAVVGRAHPRWGEVPVAFVTLREGVHVKPEELVSHVREQLASFKAPKHISFGALPKTSTGKVQKSVLRERAIDEWRERD